MKSVCGRRGGGSTCSSRDAGGATMPRKLGAFCGNWVGVASVRWDELWSGTRRPSGDGRRSAGRRLKKSPKTGAHHCLRRRKRIEPEAAPLPHVGAEGADAGVAVPLQLEDFVGHGRGNLVELLFPPVSRHYPQPPGSGVPGTSVASPSRKSADRLGWSAQPPQPHGVGLRPAAAGSALAGVFTRLCTGNEPGGGSVVALEAA